MHLLILGAAGATGRELVTRALDQGHAVTAFVREPARFDLEHWNLAVVQGDLAHERTVHKAMEGQDGVLSAVGSHSGLHREPLLVDGIRNVVGAMEEAGVKRLVYLSFVGVHESRGQLPFLGRYLEPLVLPTAVADHEENERIVKQSSLDWTIVRAPKLTKRRPSGTYRCGERIESKSVFPTIARGDVADCMLRLLEDETFVRKAMVVMH